jgi:Xaa-Pro aminopeptidase
LWYKWFNKATYLGNYMLHTLRAALAKDGMDGFILPVTDEYLGEYSPPYALRVQWLTGFDGSAGTVVVLPHSAALFTDGRYTLQAHKQLDSAQYEVKDSGIYSVLEYLSAQCTPSQHWRIAYDPWLHSVQQIRRWTESLPPHITLVATTPNPIDALWHEQPVRPSAPVVLHDEGLAGLSRQAKIAQTIAQMQADGLLLTQADAICWLLNIRGGDVPYNPLPLCRAVVMRSGKVMLFIDPRKMHGVMLEDIDIIPEEAMKHTLQELHLNSWQYCPNTTSSIFATWAEEMGVAVVESSDPIALLKAVKNVTEIENIRRAHAVDGVAVRAFLAWFDGLPKEAIITELDIIEKLEACRAMHPDYRGASFATIAGAGEHGAIVHYRATSASNRSVGWGEALLLDSGGQYPYGTTDITRTLFRGNASAAFKRHFTLVLKGHIALAMAVFPEGTTGHQLDVLARTALWEQGLDYAHGTGHGVGHYLCVHEGPQSISTRANGVALRAGMVLSNEPGYYAAGEYGIRIESLVLVVEKMRDAAGRVFLGFETLTRVPIDVRLVEDTLLSERERAWLREYNAWAVRK